MLADYGSPQEYAAELERLKAGVIEVLHLLKKDGRLRITGKAYPFWVLPGWNKKGAKALLIVTGTWAQYLGLESELQCLLSDYKGLRILYSDEDFTTGDNKLDDFLLSHGMKIMPDLSHDETEKGNGFGPLFSEN
jgi:hypothetical protein